jgi:hypothetical protein
MKKILTIILILNALFLIVYFYGYLKERVSNNIQSNSLLNLNIEYNVFKTPFYYGDKIINHIFVTYDNRTINISDKNKRFKFIHIVPSIDSSDFRIEKIFDFIELKKFFDQNNNIDFLLLVYNNPDEKIKILLSNIASKFGFYCSSIDSITLKNIYNMENLLCKLDLFIDKNNKVRIIKYNISEETKKQIKYELERIL